MSDWSLRLARPEDASALPAIEAAAAQLFRTDPQLAFLADAPTPDVESYAAILRKRRSLLASLDGAICGFLLCIPLSGELHLQELSVHPRAQRQGIASGLVRAAMIDARNCGTRALTLTTFADLPWNQGFYEKLGFQPVRDLEAHPRLRDILAQDSAKGMPAERRIAMIRFID